MSDVIHDASKSLRKIKTIEHPDNATKTKVIERFNRDKKSSSFREVPYSKIRLLNNGRITKDAAELLQLTESEVALTQEILNKHFDIMCERIRPTIITTEKGESIVFTFPALEGHGEREIQSLLDDLSSVLQYQRGKEVLELLPITRYFGGFGQFDSSIEVEPKENFPFEVRPKHDWTYTLYTDPETGEVIGSMSAAADLGFEYFPGLFQE